MVKIEINRPAWKMNTESAILNMFGYSFPLLVMNRGALLAENIHALFHRARGRDIYDTLFILRNKFPLDQYVLDSKGIRATSKKGFWTISLHWTKGSWNG